MAVIKAGPFFEEPDLRTLCQEVAEDITQQLVQEAVRCDREEARATRRSSKKMGPWSPVKRQSILRGARQRFLEQWTIQDWYPVAKKIVKQLGPPWQQARLGRRLIFGPVAFAALALLLKLEGPDVEELLGKARAAGIDCRTDRAKAADVGNKVPSPAYFDRRVKEKVSAEYLRQVLRLVDQYAAEEYQERFPGAFINESAIDGANSRTNTLEIATPNQFTTWTFKRVPWQAVVRVTTNTVVDVERLANSSQASVQRACELLPAGSILTADKAFDSERNYRAAEAAAINFQAKGRKFNNKYYQGEARARGQAKFDLKIYRRRKLGEVPFGNAVTRGLGPVREKSPQIQLLALLLWAIAQGLLAWRGQVFYNQAVRSIPGGWEGLLGPQVKGPLLWQADPP